METKQLKQLIKLQKSKKGSLSVTKTVQFSEDGAGIVRDWYGHLIFIIDKRIKNDDLVLVETDKTAKKIIKTAKDKEFTLNNMDLMVDDYNLAGTVPDGNLLYPDSKKQENKEKRYLRNLNRDEIKELDSMRQLIDRKDDRLMTEGILFDHDQITATDAKKLKYIKTETNINDRVVIPSGLFYVLKKLNIETIKLYRNSSDVILENENYLIRVEDIKINYPDYKSVCSFDIIDRHKKNNPVYKASPDELYKLAKKVKKLYKRSEDGKMLFRAGKVIAENANIKFEKDVDFDFPAVDFNSYLLYDVCKHITKDMQVVNNDINGPVFFYNDSRIVILMPLGQKKSSRAA